MEKSAGGGQEDFNGGSKIPDSENKGPLIGKKKLETPVMLSIEEGAGREDTSFIKGVASFGSSEIGHELRRRRRAGN